MLQLATTHINKQEHQDVSSIQDVTYRGLQLLKFVAKGYLI